MSKKVNYLILALVASVFFALYNMFDNIVLHGPLDNLYSYSIIAGLIGIVITITCGTLLGRRIEPSFTGLKILPKKAMFFAFGGGVFGAFMTLFYLIGSSSFNPSIIIPLSQTSLIYLLLIDWLFIEKTSPSLIEIESVIVIIIGSFLVTFHAGQINLMAVLIFLILYNLCFIMYVIFKQKGMRVYGVDAINFRLWLFIFLTLFLGISSTVISLLNQTLDIVIYKIINNFNSYLPWTILSMIFVFLYFVFDLRALKTGKASIVQSVESLSIILAILMTLVCSLFFPHIFGEIEWNFYSWFIKIGGSLLIVLGILIFALSESIRYYVIIKPKFGKEREIFNKLKKIKEIEYMAMSVNSDIIIKLNVKTVGRVNDTITTKIKNIGNIKNIISMPILKEI